MEPTQWLEDRAYGFNQLSTEEREAVKDFSLLWSLYEGSILETAGNAEAIIRAVGTLKRQSKLTLQPFASAIDFFRGRYWDGTNFTAAFENLHLRKADHRSLVECVIRGQSTDPSEVLSAILIIIFRLRNNLFHGIKWAYGIRDQFGNFRSANDVLMAAIELHQS